MCGDSSVDEKHVNGNYAIVNELQRQKFDGIQRTLHSWRKRGIAYPVRKIDDDVKHEFREHNQEADHLGNLGAEGKSKITNDGKKTLRKHRKQFQAIGTVEERTTDAVAVVS